MITRRSANLIGQCYRVEFSGRNSVYKDGLYDFLFDHDYSIWFCNSVKGIYGARSLKEHVMRLHTGETQAKATASWTWKQRQELGQTYLEKLSVDILNRDLGYDSGSKEVARNELKSNLELDGYDYRDNRLIPTEIDTLDDEDPPGILAGLFVDLRLANVETAMHCLKLSEEHWLAQNWDDTISNARRFLESALQEVATAHSANIKGREIDNRVYSRPARVREYLETEGLLERQEIAAIRETYGLLSQTGSHPYIAEKDQARLLRQVALLYSQFVMLRYQGALASNGIHV